MDLTVLLASATLLSIERISYAWIWHYPYAFCELCEHPMVAIFGTPVKVLQKLFYLFKFIQLSVFVAWCIVFGQSLLPLPSNPPGTLAVGAALMLFGQLLNLSVFYRLGLVGVFYGNKLGHRLDWCEGFPFSIFNHPQYVGASISIWGFFLVMRFPHDDWIVLPIIETVYYTLGAYAERS